MRRRWGCDSEHGDVTPVMSAADTNPAAGTHRAAFKRHLGAYPPVRGDARLQQTLKSYANAKGNLSFPLAEPIPLALIARVAKALAKQHQPDTPRRKRPD
jgi:uncharacterized protein YdhG (YjbR/CyaY superfamily)